MLTKLIERNTTIPTSKSRRFSPLPRTTSRRGDPCACRASASCAQYNKTLGNFHLEGIPPAPRGVPQIEVTFDIDVNGIVHVSAKDKGTGKDKKITITASSGLAKDEVERMVREAESHAADDARRREEVEVRNSADNMVYSARRPSRSTKSALAAT